MFIQNKNGSEEFGENLRKRIQETDRHLDSVLDPETGAEIVDHLGPAMSSQELAVALAEESERVLGKSASCT